MINIRPVQCIRRSSIGLCILVVFYHSGSVRADGSEALKQRFLQEAPPAWEEYRAFAGRLQGAVERTITIEGKIRSITRIECKSNPRCKMVLSQSQLTEDSSGEVLAFNPRYGFNLKRKSNETPWLLADLQMGKSRPGPKGWDDFAIFRLCISTQLYELPDLIRLPNFRVVHASMAQEGGLELCQIKFESKLTDGVLHLDPNRLWTVHHSSVRERSSDQIILARQEIELRDPTGKYPIPKRWILHKEFTNGPNVGKSASQVIEEFDVKELAEPPDDDEFTLSAFGLPEPMGMPAPAKSHTYLWIALAAGGAVALALLFRWLGLRSRKA